MNSKKKISSPNSTCNSILVLNQPCCQSRRDLPRGVYVWVKEAELASLFVSCAQHMHQMGASHMRPTPPLPWHTHVAAFVHISQMLGGVHQRGGRRGARRAAHRGRAGPEPFGRSLLKLSSLCTCAGRRERAGSSLRAGAIVGANGISGQVSEHRDCIARRPTTSGRAESPSAQPTAETANTLYVTVQTSDSHNSRLRGSGD